MMQFTIFIIDSETEEPVFNLSIDEDQSLSSVQWKKLINGLANAFETDEKNVVFGHDYYLWKIDHLNYNLEHTNDILEDTELEDYSTEMRDKWLDEREEYKVMLKYELENPFKH